MGAIRNYTLTRSKRRTVALYVRNGGVEVRAPLKMSRRDIDRFVASKEKWITERLAKSQKQSEHREKFALNYGDTIALRGARRAITERDGTLAGYDGAVFYFPPNLTPEKIKTVCVQIYRRLAKIHFTQRVLHYAEQIGIRPAAVKVNPAKTRWGSCSAGKNINFSWRLIMVEDSVIDYVVVHELAHLMEMNHSEKFWAIVESVLPDFRQRQARLKEFQRSLNSENWD